MSESAEVTALFKAIEAAPEDWLALGALGDWFEEQGQETKAEACHWLAEHRKTPFRYDKTVELRYHHDTWRKGWFWWTTDRERAPWGYPDSCMLPHDLWDRLRHKFGYDPMVFKEYRSIRAALEAVLTGWSQPTKKRRRTRKR